MPLTVSHSIDSLCGYWRWSIWIVGHPLLYPVLPRTGITVIFNDSSDGRARRKVETKPAEARPIVANSVLKIGSRLRGGRSGGRSQLSGY